MADDLLASLGTNDLLNFNTTVTQSDPYRIASGGLAAWQPDMGTWSGPTQGVTAFGKAFLSGLLANTARQNASDQLSKVVNVLPQLRSDPYNTAVPEGVDADAFNALKGTAILKDSVRQEAKKAQISDLLKSVLGPSINSGALSPQDAIKVLSSDDPKAALSTLGSTSTGESPRMKALLDANKITDPNARAGIKTPDDLSLYMLHGPGAAQDKADAKKAVSNEKLETQLRKELEKVNSPYQQAITLAPLVKVGAEVAKLNNPQGDMALVDTLAKAYNPGGVLRAQFVAQLEDSQNPLNKFSGEINRVFNGGKFNDETRSQILGALNAQVGEKLASGKSYADQKLSIAKNKQMDVENIIPADYYSEIFGSVADHPSVSAASAAPQPSQFSSAPEYLAAYRAWESQQ